MKQNTAKRFQSKQSNYSPYARVQQQALRSLADMMEIHCPKMEGLWIDFGAGPEDLHRPYFRDLDSIDVVLADLAYGAEASSASLICADFDHPPLKDGVASGLICASALQWSPTPMQSLEMLLKLLKPGGTAALALLCDNTLRELREVQKEFGVESPITTISDISISDSYTILDKKRYTFIERYSSAKDSLKAISKIGATATNSPPLSPKRVREFIEAYRLHAEDSEGGITNSYSYLIALIRRRSNE